MISTRLPLPLAPCILETETLTSDCPLQLVSLLSQHGQDRIGQETAEQVVTRWYKQGKYRQDVWS